jgi:hypothetical protein
MEGVWYVYVGEGSASWAYCGVSRVLYSATGLTLNDSKLAHAADTVKAVNGWARESRTVAELGGRGLYGTQAGSDRWTTDGRSMLMPLRRVGCSVCRVVRADGGRRVFLVWGDEDGWLDGR